MSEITTNLIKEFLAAHTIKNITELVYSWDINQLSATIDSTIASRWFEWLNNKVDFKEYNINLYGDRFTITIPVFSDEIKYENISDEYKQLVFDYLKDWLFSDKKGAVIFKLLDSFELWLFEWIIAFYPQWDAWEKLLKTVSSTVVDVWAIKVELDINNINDINRYENIMLLFKEVSDWYYDCRKHSIVDKIQWTHVQQEYTLARDVYVKVNIKTQEVLEVTQTETKYGSRKWRDWWYIITPNIIWYTEVKDEEGNVVWEDPVYEEINSKDFVPYITKSEWDITEIRMYWAYTHMLRDLLDFKPLTWQYKFLLNQKRISFVAGCRRAGKTRLTAYLILRALWKQPNSVKHVQRQVKALYLAPSEDKQKEVVDYIKSTSERIRLLKVIDFNKKENRLYLYDEVTSRNMKVQNVVANCDFVSAKWFEPWRGKASDEIFIDEGSITPEDAFINLLPIIWNERAKLFAVGTIDWTTRKQWFYKWLVESERGIDEEQYWLRVTIDDLDEEHVPQADKDRMKRMLKDNSERYYAELYASFPDNTWVFDSEWFFNLTKERQPFEKVWWYIIWYDPAKRSDIWAIEVGEYRMWSMGWYIQLIEEYSLQWDYTNQKDILRQIKTKYQTSWLWCPVYVVMDATQVWDVVAEMFWDIIDYKTRWTSKGTRPVIDNYWAWKVPKNHLVHLTQILIEKWLIKWWIWLKELVDQFKTYKAIDTSSGNVKYEAEVWHDDHVSAMLLIWFYMWYIEWRIYEFAMDWQVIRPEWITDDWLYESTTRRSSMEALDTIMWKGFSFGV